ncbi:SDR family NAD(P)-dependent oxidoreductase [Brachybacterium sp. GPGPB12]|uniref:SDR family oxidoreductase n=1 Tax=Brachybacterium sp. GPGPB12 TaxID=3023517 RepID=UPI003134615A
MTTDGTTASGRGARDEPPRGASAAGPRTVWITGAGAGMGRATAARAARSGWTVALSGRRREVLERLAAEIREAGGAVLVAPLDVQDRKAVRSTAERIAERLGGIDALVLAAGLNAPKRRWDDQDLTEFDEIVATNLTAVASTVDAALPACASAAGRSW